MFKNKDGSYNNIQLILISLILIIGIFITLIYISENVELPTINIPSIIPAQTTIQPISTIIPNTMISDKFNTTDSYYNTTSYVLGNMSAINNVSGVEESIIYTSYTTDPYINYNYSYINITSTHISTINQSPITESINQTVDSLLIPYNLKTNIIWIFIIIFIIMFLLLQRVSITVIFLITMIMFLLCNSNVTFLITGIFTILFYYIFLKIR